MLCFVLCRHGMARMIPFCPGHEHGGPVTIFILDGHMGMGGCNSRQTHSLPGPQGDIASENQSEKSDEAGL